MKLDSNDVLAAHGVDAYRAATQAAIARIPGELAHRTKPIDLLNADTSADPNCLLGRRWICRGGACIWTGPSGCGKSALTMQAAALWAAGLDFFGIQPVRPLRSIIIQAENDEMDLAEQFKGVMNGLKLFDCADIINENLDIFTETGRTGNAFPPFVRSLAALLKPDLVWIDPLMTYLGGGISDDTVVTPFIRQGLDPIAKEFGFAYQIAHHIPKPRVDAKLSRWTTSDYAYAGIGSSELTNWPRAAMHLKKTEEHKFDLMATKRGGRAGMHPPPILDEFGNPTHQPETDVIPIEWGPDGIYWIPSDSAPKRLDLTDDDICKLLADKWITCTRLIEKIQSTYEIGRSKSRNAVEEFLERNDLHGISKEDGEKSFRNDTVLAKKDGRAILLKGLMHNA